MKNEVCPCHSSQFVLASLYSRAPVRSQWRKVCRITVQTHPEYRQLWPTGKRAKTARRVAWAPRLRVCPEPASPSLPELASPPLVLVKAGTRSQLGVGPARVDGTLRSERSIEHRVIRATTGGATRLVVGLLCTGLPSHNPRQPISLGSWSECQPGTLTQSLSFS